MDFSYLDEYIEEAAGSGIQEGGEGYRNIWVLAETEAGVLLPVTLEAMGQARDLADQIGTYVYAVLLGVDVAPLAQELISYGADKVLLVEDPALAQYQPEIYVQAVADLVARLTPEILLLPATQLGRDFAPRLAQKLDTGLASRCCKLDMDMSERLLLATFPILGGEVFHTLVCTDARPQMATLLPGSFRTPAANPYRSGEVESVEVDISEGTGRLTWLDMDAAVELPPVPLGKSRIVVSAGRGMGDAEGFALVEKLAAALGGTVAGSRGAFDEGWIGEDRVVGVGGQTITPDLYVACGLSGDIFHHFGAQAAKAVLAINADADAPIMKVANWAVVGDARKIIPAMLKALAG